MEKLSSIEMEKAYNPKDFEELSIGELVQLPKELFLEAVEEPFQPICEPF